MPAEMPAMDATDVRLKIIIKNNKLELYNKDMVWTVTLYTTHSYNSVAVANTNVQIFCQWTLGKQIQVPAGVSIRAGYRWTFIGEGSFFFFIP